MLYTFLKFLGWGILLAFIGGCIGWALRALKCRREVAAARSSTVDQDEVERMRHRLANLEQVVAERDRLRIQLADVRHADSPGIVGAALLDEPEPEPEVAEVAEVAPEVAEVAEVVEVVETDVHEVDDVIVLAPDGSIASETISVDTSTTVERSTTVAGFAAVGGDATTESDDTDLAPALDLDAAAAAIGKSVKLDDLTVVEGIGPKISELCRGIGVTTWRQLADTDVADLQSMLDAAGSRYAVHKPGTWPQQAELLATGQWAAFKTLTDELDGGK